MGKDSPIMPTVATLCELYPQDDEIELRKFFYRFDTFIEWNKSMRMAAYVEERNKATIKSVREILVGIALVLLIGFNIRNYYIWEQRYNRVATPVPVSQPIGEVTIHLPDINQ